MSDKPKNRAPELVALLRRVVELTEEAGEIASDLDDEFPDEAWSHAAREVLESLSVYIAVDEFGQLVAGAVDGDGQCDYVERRVALPYAVEVFASEYPVEEHSDAHRALRDELERALSYLPPKSELPPRPESIQGPSPEGAGWFEPLPRNEDEADTQYGERMRRLRKAQALARKWAGET